MDLHLRGRSALVTGASRGIGLAIARILAAEGCNLHLAARNAKLLDEVAGEIRGTHKVTVAVHSGDLGDPAAVKALGTACRDVDILMNNAGDIPVGNLQEVDDAAWHAGWSVKVFGYIGLTRLILPRMYERKSGVVVNIIGVAGEIPNPNYIAGCMGNASLMTFTECLGAESVAHGVRVVGVNPGPTMSDRHRSHVMARAEKRLGDANRYKELEAMLPAGRSADVAEVAHAAVFFASDLASHISGTTLRIDAGLKVMPRKH
jgi:hypothetical protein